MMPGAAAKAGNGCMEKQDATVPFLAVKRRYSLGTCAPREAACEDRADGREEGDGEWRW